MTRQQVAAELVAYGRELEEQGAAQVGDSFTGDPLADALLERPDAFVIGVLFTQGVPAERAWRGPYELQRRLGTIDLEYLATHPDEVRGAFQQPPMLHRFKETLPRWVVSAARWILDEYAGRAERIWAPGSSVLEVTERLSAFDGIGRKKSVMATEILTRHFGAELTGRECGQVAYDVQVRRVFLRSGLADVDSIESIEAAAAEFCPGSPGTLDLPAWLIGRQTCRPKVPACDACRLGTVCERRTWLSPAGVGQARGSAAKR